jgi:hypothetical protein
MTHFKQSCSGTGTVLRIRDVISRIPDPTITPSRIPDPGGKKAPDPGSGTLQRYIRIRIGSGYNDFCGSESVIRIRIPDPGAINFRKNVLKGTGTK